jgi:hypothetical protein
MFKPVNCRSIKRILALRPDSDVVYRVVEFIPI